MWFFEIFDGLPRQGPGDEAGPIKALTLVPGVGIGHASARFRVRHRVTDANSRAELTGAPRGHRQPPAICRGGKPPGTSRRTRRSHRHPRRRHAPAGLRAWLLQSDLVRGSRLRRRIRGRSARVAPAARPRWPSGDDRGLLEQAGSTTGMRGFLGSRVSRHPGHGDAAEDDHRVRLRHRGSLLAPGLVVVG